MSNVIRLQTAPRDVSRGEPISSVNNIIQLQEQAERNRINRAMVDLADLCAASVRNDSEYMDAAGMVRF